MQKIRDRLGWPQYDGSPFDSAKDLALSVIAIGLAIYMVYATVYGPYKTTIVHMALYLSVSLLLYFLSEVRQKGRFGFVLDWGFALISAVSTLYIVVEYERIVNLMSASSMSTMDFLMGCGLVISALEAARRQSIVFALLALLATFYTLYGAFAPGVFQHPGLSMERFIFLNAYGPEGIFGLGLSVATNYLFMFILMATAFKAVGTTQFLLDISSAAFGRLTGGPGKASLFASAGLGSVVGSPVANVALTGSMTIPMMVDHGFKKEQAAAIEVLNSEGAQLVPPILGIAAFIMVELTGMTYATVVAAAVVPALLYYLSAYVIIDLEARKLGLRRDSGQLADIPGILLSGIHLVIPIFALFIFIFHYRFTPAYAGMVCFGLSIIFAQLRRASRFGLFRLLRILDEAVREAAKITGFIAALGLVEQGLTVTGLGVRMSEVFLVLSGGNEFAMLFLAVITTILFGMGMPTPLAYTLGAVFVAPPLVDAGFPLLAAHMFVFFFAIKSGSTPPVAVVAVVGAAIAKANWWPVAFLSFWYSLPGWLVAFAFMYAPELLHSGGTLFSNVWAISFATAGVFATSVALVGYWFGVLNLALRALLAVAGALTIAPGELSDVIGLAAIAVVLAPRLTAYLRRPSTA